MGCIAPFRNCAVDAGSRAAPEVPTSLNDESLQPRNGTRLLPSSTVLSTVASVVAFASVWVLIIVWQD